MSDSADPWDPADLSVLDAYLYARHSDTYAGLCHYNDDAVHIFRTAAAALDDDVAAHARIPVRLHLAAHTRAELDQVADRVIADCEHWRKHGIRIGGVVVPHDGTTVEILTPHAETARALLLERYGETLITVTSGDIVPL